MVEIHLHIRLVVVLFQEFEEPHVNRTRLDSNSACALLKPWSC